VPLGLLRLENSNERLRVRTSRALDSDNSGLDVDLDYWDTQVSKTALQSLHRQSVPLVFRFLTADGTLPKSLSISSSSISLLFPFPIEVRRTSSIEYIKLLGTPHNRLRIVWQERSKMGQLVKSRTPVRDLEELLRMNVLHPAGCASVVVEEDEGILSVADRFPKCSAGGFSVGGKSSRAGCT
jgi:hypothetical protein